LAQWLRDHEKGMGGDATAGLVAPTGPTITSGAESPAPPEAPPNFRFWIEEANRLLEAGAAGTATYSDALFCARKALASGASDLERAEAKYVLGLCQSRSNALADALAAFSEIAADFDSATDTERRAWQAKALFGKGFTLFELGRFEDAIAVSDEVIARFGAASELALRQPVARALVNKGATLAQLGRFEDAIAVFDDVIARFGAASELVLRVQVAGALVAKGIALGQLGRGEEEIAVYGEVIARFGTDKEPAIKSFVEYARNTRSAHGSKTESQ
jgi:tetratricopeptide (TPR) repeat protein